MESPFPEIKEIKVLYDEREIANVVQEAAQNISKKYLPILEQSRKENRAFKLVFVAVLSGANRYRTDLANEVGRIFREAGYYGYIEEDEISVSSYLNGEKRNEISFLLDLKRPIEGSSVILVEDIVDSGTTAVWVKEKLLSKNPSSLDFYVLIDKTSRREKKIELDHVGFRLNQDVFVLGYGLDVNGRFRELPFIGYIP